MINNGKRVQENILCNANRFSNVIRIVCLRFSTWFRSKKDAEGMNIEYKDERCSTEWVEDQWGYKTRYGWVLICGGWMVSEEDGEMTSKPERMKVFPDLSSVFVYKMERMGMLKDARPHYATLCFKNKKSLVNVL